MGGLPTFYFNRINRIDAIFILFILLSCQKIQSPAVSDNCFEIFGITTGT